MRNAFATPPARPREAHVDRLLCVFEKILPSLQDAFDGLPKSSEVWKLTAERLVGQARAWGIPASSLEASLKLLDVVVAGTASDFASFD